MLIVDSKQRSRSVTMDINDFLVLLNCVGCYSWSVRMCSKFKDTVGLFSQMHETPLQKEKGTWLITQKGLVVCM